MFLLLLTYTVIRHYLGTKRIIYLLCVCLIIVELFSQML